MSDIRCPHCAHDHSGDSDWVYDKGLYEPDIEIVVKCQRCDQKFSVRSWSSIEWETDLIDEAEEDENTRKAEKCL